MRFETEEHAIQILRQQKGAELVFQRELQSGSLLTRHAHIQALLQSLLLVDSGNLNYGQCNLRVSWCGAGDSGLVLDEVCIGGLYGVVAVCVGKGGLGRLLLKLEQMDRALLRRGIDVRQLLGLATDGCSQWHLVRRRNKQRLVASDVLNDPLFKNGSNKDAQQQLQAAASLAKERWQLFKRRRDRSGSAMSPLYDGCVMDCDMSRSSSELHKISRAIHGLICQQRSDFREAFQAAMRHNSELNRPATNPYHEVNRKQQKKQCQEYLDLCRQGYDAREDFTQCLTQTE